MGKDLGEPGDVGALVAVLAGEVAEVEAVVAPALGEVLLAGGSGGAGGHGAAAGVVGRVADDGVDGGVEGGEEGQGVAGVQRPSGHFSSPYRSFLIVQFHRTVWH